MRYLQWRLGKVPKQECRFCGEEHEEFIHLVCECPSLAKERVEIFHVFQLSQHTLDIKGLIRFKNLTPIDEAFVLWGQIKMFGVSIHKCEREKTSQRLHNRDYHGLREPLSKKRGMLTNNLCTRSNPLDT